MRAWSFPFGRVLGVELRMHAFFLLLLGFSISFGIYVAGNGARGFVLWCMLVLAVLIREAARALAAAYFNLELTSILLVPTGGLPTYSLADTRRPKDSAAELAAHLAIERRMALVGPVANLAFGAVLAAFVLGVAPEVDLYARPWVTAAHLLKAFVWVNLLLGAVNLLPAPPLDGGRLFRLASGKATPPTRRLASIGQMIAIGLIVAGVVFASVWFIMIGFFVLLGAQMEDQGLLIQTEVDTITMRDVMLTDYTTLSASDTLEDALERAVHSLQDVFPVVRGGTIVGAVSRQRILSAHAAGGNSYIQGIMARTFEIAHPEDALVKTLGRIAGSEGAQFVPVLQGERVLGIVTPHHLSQSIRLRGLLPRRNQDREPRD